MTLSIKVNNETVEHISNDDAFKSEKNIVLMFISDEELLEFVKNSVNESNEISGGESVFTYEKHQSLSSN